MRRPTPNADWPSAWKLSFHYDLMEIFEESPRSGYARAYQARSAATLRLLARVAPPGSSVLDVAGGQGNFSIRLADLGYEVTWNDLRADLVEYIKQKTDAHNIRFRPGNILEQRFEQPFDVIVACEVIEHVAHPDEFLRQLASLVRPGGHILLTTPNGEYFRNRLPKFSDCPDPERYEAVQFKPDADGHIFLLHEHEVRDLAERAGLRVEAIEQFTNPLTAGALRTDRILPHLPTWPVDGLEAVTRRFPRWLRARMHLGQAVLLSTPLSREGAREQTP